jgi:DNA-binding CsgD family transcriptional regulator
MEITSKDLQAISKIYDVALDSTKWTGVLNELAQQVGGIGSNVSVADHTIGELTSIQLSTKLMPGVATYLEGGYAKQDVAAMPNFHNIIPDQRFMTPDAIFLEHNRRYGTKLDQSGFGQWLASNLGIKHRFTSPLNHRKAYVDLVTFHFGDLNQTQLQGSLARASIFLPHLAKVVEISRPFSLLKARFDAVLSVLDRFHLGVAIFSSSGSLVLSNQAAQKILERRDGLGLGKNNLSATAAMDKTIELKQAFIMANQVMDNGDFEQPSQVIVPRRSGATPYIVDVSPLRNREIDLKAVFKGVVAIIVDPDDHQIIDTSGLELLYSLTNAEKEVCRLLVSGLSTTEIADTRGTNPETTRKQINMLLNKTESRGRSELVHLAHSINLPVDQSD